MIVWPLKFRPLRDGSIVFADDSGGFFRGSPEFLERYAHDALSDDDAYALRDCGHAFDQPDDLAYAGFACRWSQRQAKAGELAYVVLVPTLRCNLTCTYCQVSRAAVDAKGYDWSNETLAAALAFLGGLKTRQIKIEFQGGEPLLRLDLLQAVRDFCRNKFERSEFVVCTNLQVVEEEAWKFLSAEDTYVSTSLDASRSLHEEQRTQDRSATNGFFRNLDRALATCGKRVSALPTIDPKKKIDLRELLSLYTNYGLTSIYLRPVNHQGFARRNLSVDASSWACLHREFVELLIDHNARADSIVEEYYFSQCLKRILRPGEDGHVDLRNPSQLGADYVLIDHDGRIFPTDEARMLYRIGHVDLSIGHITTGFDTNVIASLNASSFNNFDPDCIHCPYQAFCGTDVVDDISRYNRIDVPRPSTWFCQRQLAVFDLAFELIYRNDQKTRHSLAAWAGIASWPPEIAPEIR